MILGFALAAAASVLVSCGDEPDQPGTLPPVTRSPLSSATASPTPTATSDVKRSAEDFVRAYVRELQRANYTADPSQLERGFYDPVCRPCKYDVSVLNGFRRKEHHIEGYGVSLDLLESSDLQGNTVAVTVELRNHAGRVVDKYGKTVRELSATQAIRTDVILVRGPAGWRILDIVPLGEVK